MLREKSCLGKRLLAVIFLGAALAIAAQAIAADGRPPTVSILNPKPGTAAAPTVVSLRLSSSDFKVQVQVWDDAAIAADSVEVGYYSGTTPESGTFTFVPAVLNANYTCGTNCGVYEAVISGLTADVSYYLYARATSADGTGESRQNRTGNDETGIRGAVDLAHPAGPERADDFVGTQSRSGREHHALPEARNGASTPAGADASLGPARLLRAMFIRETATL